MNNDKSNCPEHAEGVKVMIVGDDLEGKQELINAINEVAGVVYGGECMDFEKAAAMNYITLPESENPSRLDNTEFRGGSKKKGGKNRWPNRFK